MATFSTCICSKQFWDPTLPVNIHLALAWLLSSLMLCSCGSLLLAPLPNGLAELGALRKWSPVSKPLEAVCWWCWRAQVLHQPHLEHLNDILAAWGSPGWNKSSIHSPWLHERHQRHESWKWHWMKTSSLHVVRRRAIPKWMGSSLKLGLWGSTSGHAHNQCRSQVEHALSCFTVANFLQHIQTCLPYPLCQKMMLNSRHLDATPITGAMRSASSAFVQIKKGAKLTVIKWQSSKVDTFNPKRSKVKGVDIRIAANWLPATFLIGVCCCSDALITWGPECWVRECILQASFRGEAWKRKA